MSYLDYTPSPRLSIDSFVSICNPTEFMVLSCCMFSPLCSNHHSPVLPPSAPTIIMAVSQSPTSINFTWTQPEGEIVDSYEVSFSYQGPCSGFNHTNTTTVNGTTRQYTLTGLQEFSNYTVTITAVNTALQAAAMETITLSTTATSVFYHHTLYVGVPSCNTLYLSLSPQQYTPGSHCTHT